MVDDVAVFFRKRQISEGVWTMSPQEYVPLLKELGVTCIVRFNSKCYDRAVFTTGGIRLVFLCVQIRNFICNPCFVETQTCGFILRRWREPNRRDIASILATM
jgi:hypothetical protein